MELEKVGVTITVRKNHKCGKSCRTYLFSEYKIAKQTKMFNEVMEPRVKVNYFFSRVFNSEINIGFVTPATDVCDTKVSAHLFMSSSLKKNNSYDLIKNA